MHFFGGCRVCVGARCKYSNALGIAEDNYMCCSCVQEVKNGYGRRTHFLSECVLLRLWLRGGCSISYSMCLFCISVSIFNMKMTFA